MPLKLHYTGKCGHNDVATRDHKLADAPALRDYYLKHKLCQECYKAEQDKLREEKKARELASAKENSAELPELCGSEKQIQWALTLRYKTLQAIKEINLYNADNPNAQLIEELRNEYIVNLSSKNEAKYWIDNFRNEPTKSEIMEMLAKLNAQRAAKN